MANKRERQATILELINARAVASQEDLRRLLLQRGWDVTQATLSRDLRELRIGRVPMPEGVRYAPANGGEDSRATLAALIPQLYSGVDGVGELVVVKTVRGGAQPIAEALDNERWPEIVGTIAGDDSILVVCRSGTAREKVIRRIKGLTK
jgi:transcriptional regulator of arginine metabolism